MHRTLLITLAVGSLVIPLAAQVAPPAQPETPISEMITLQIQIPKAVFDAAWAEVKQQRKTTEDPVSNKTITEPIYADLGQYLSKVLCDVLAPYTQRVPSTEIQTLMEEIRTKQTQLEQLRRQQVVVRVQ